MALRRRSAPRGRAHWPHFRTLIHALFDRRAPLHARLIALAVLAYAVWPFDIIPDVIPVAGWIDDLIIVPLGLWLAFRLIPDEVIADARRKVEGADTR
ncbi:MAG: YkvA family protein [Gemmatimonas sp.]